MYKALLFFSCCMLLLMATQAQQTNGIQFLHGNSWEQIKSRAKKEGKYIFIDGFTTWCVPCKEMAANIFPQPKVADFFNKNFINIEVQFDVTKKDDADVKSWYADAKDLARRYKVDSYPTFLFFNPDGELVHKVVGGFTDPNDFIKQARIALDPNMQYLVLKQKILNGAHDTSAMSALLNSGHLANDKQFLDSIINRYLLTQKNLLTKKNIDYVITATGKVEDPGFEVLIDYHDRIDAIAGKGKSFKMAMNILQDDVALPYLRNNGRKKVYSGGMMVVYEGEVNKTVDWPKLKTVLDTRYKSVADAELLFAHCTSFYWSQDWPAYDEAVNQFILKYNQSVNAEMLIGFANPVLNACDNKECVNSAVEWSKKAVDALPDPRGMYVYSRLLAKAGRKQEAIDFLESKIGAPAEKAKYPNLDALLTDMKAGK